jgi:hypothetical protein
MGETSEGFDTKDLPEAKALLNVSRNTSKHFCRNMRSSQSAAAIQSRRQT